MTLELLAEHADARARFWPKVDAGGGPDACWLWTGAINRMGRGLFAWSSKRRSRRTVTAPRAAWALSSGEMPGESIYVLHRCDNPRCVNPAHLFLGTQADNMHDCATKGRIVSYSGARNGRAKLSADQVAEIRQRAEAGESHRAIAVAYGVRPGNVWHIVNGSTWRSQ